MADQTLTLVPVQRMTEGRRTMEDIPSEVIQEILSKLPINSLFQSRLVSKIWGALGKERKLSLMHYEQSLRDRNPSNLLLYSFDMELGKHCLYCIPDFETFEKTILLNNLPFEDQFPDFNIVGSCKGLLCFHEVPSCCFIVCNPVCGDWIILQRHLRVSKHEYSSAYFGFGYSAKSKEYKVLRILRNITIPGPLIVEVNTLGSPSWRVIETSIWTLGGKEGEKCGVFLNGYLHWLVPKVGIIAFDVENEIFEFVPISPFLAIKNNDGVLSLGVFGGCLMLLDSSHQYMEQVWLMKDYRVTNSLVFEFCIQRPIYSIVRPIGIQSTGNVVFHFDFSGFSSYDPKKGTHLKLRVPGLPRVHRVIPHVGTKAQLKDILTKEH